MRLIFRVLRLLMTVAVAAAIVWYVWALFPSIGRPPGVGKLFTKPSPNISKLASELRAVPPGRLPIPTSEVKKACETPFFLRPLQGPADHVVLEVTSGLITIERNVSCKTHGFTGPWRRAP